MIAAGTVQIWTEIFKGNERDSQFSRDLHCFQDKACDCFLRWFKH